LGEWEEMGELLWVVDSCGDEEVEGASSSSFDNWRAECECLDNDLADLAAEGTRRIVDSWKPAVAKLARRGLRYDRSS
jgi:hypothetical protein